MNKIEEAKKLLQQKINRLREKEAKIKLMERIPKRKPFYCPLHALASIIILDLS